MRRASVSVNDLQSLHKLILNTQESANSNKIEQKSQKSSAWTELIENLM